MSLASAAAASSVWVSVPAPTTASKVDVSCVVDPVEPPVGQCLGMGLFRKQPKAREGYAPLPQGFDNLFIGDEIAANFRRPVTERNAFANAALEPPRVW